MTKLNGKYTMYPWSLHTNLFMGVSAPLLWTFAGPGTKFIGRALHFRLGYLKSLSVSAGTWLGKPKSSPSQVPVWRRSLINLNFHQDYTHAWTCDITVELLWSVWAIYILPFMAVIQAITTDPQARDTWSKAKITALANRNQGGVSLKTTSACDNIGSYFITFYGTLTLSSFWVISKLNRFQNK